MHVIPPGEFDLHIESANCECGPEVDFDEPTGEIYYFHIPLSLPFTGVEGL